MRVDEIRQPVEHDIQRRHAAAEQRLQHARDPRTGHAGTRPARCPGRSATPGHRPSPCLAPAPSPDAAKSGRDGSRSPAPPGPPAAPKHRSRRRKPACVCFTVLTGSNTVTSGNRPKPGALPSMPCVSIRASPSICKPPQMPSTRAAALRMLGDRAVKALGAQPGQVAARVLGAGQDDPVGALSSAGLRAQTQAHARHVLAAAGIRRGC